MPSLGADMDAGTIVEWKVHPGDVVHRGDILAVIDTDKADIDAESFEDGVIGELLVAEGEKVPVGTVLATFSGAGRPEAQPLPVSAQPTAPRPEPKPEPEPEPRVLSPLVRKLAAREHVELDRVHGSGPGGAIRRADVEAASRRRVSPRARRLAAVHGVDLAAVRTTGAITGADVEAAREPIAPPPTRTPTPTPTTRERSATRRQTMQQRTAALMERSNREIPHFHLSLDCEVSSVTSWLQDRNAGMAPRERIVPAAVILTAISRAAVEVRGFNGWWQDGDFVESPGVELGCVVALRGGGLLVPVIAAAQTLAVTEMMVAMYGAVERARTGRLRSSELGQPSITVTSLGDQGADAVHGVIYPPQVALVGVGRVAERPWAREGLVGARPTVRLTLAADHRVSDGHQGSRFLGAIERLLRDPAAMDKEGAS